jgi:hypothetical protein
MLLVNKNTSASEVLNRKRKDTTDTCVRYAGTKESKEKRRKRGCGKGKAIQGDQMRFFKSRPKFCPTHFCQNECINFNVGKK